MTTLPLTFPKIPPGPGPEIVVEFDLTMLLYLFLGVLIGYWIWRNAGKSD